MAGNKDGESPTNEVQAFPKRWCELSFARGQRQLGRGITQPSPYFFLSECLNQWVLGCVSSMPVVIGSQYAAQRNFFDISYYTLSVGEYCNFGLNRLNQRINVSDMELCIFYAGLVPSFSFHYTPKLACLCCLLINEEQKGIHPPLLSSYSSSSLYINGFHFRMPKSEGP